MRRPPIPARRPRAARPAPDPAHRRAPGRALGRALGLVATLAGPLVPPVASALPPAGWVRADGPRSPLAVGTTSELREQFGAAAAEFGVPERVLLALSYSETRWETHGGRPSTSGAYGPMALLDAGPTGGPAPRPPAPSLPAPSLPGPSLTAAAGLLGRPTEDLRRDPAQNIRGAAALLAHHAARLAPQSRSREAEWHAVLARYGGGDRAEVGLALADDVLAVLRSGVSRTTADGQTLGLDPSDVRPARAGGQGTAGQGPTGGRRSDADAEAECPPRLACTFVPAAYQQTDPDDVTAYGNYDRADRPRDGLAISSIVIHDTEVSFDRTLAIFTDPRSRASAHYVVRSADGAVVQMVRTADVAYQAGNFGVNMHSIGIEHEGVAVEGASWYTERLYRASAALVRYLARRHHIPLDRGHVLGHDEVPGPTPERVAGMHWDPGPYWDWDHYLELAGARRRPSGLLPGPVLTIRPDFDRHRPPVTSCDEAGTCRQLPDQGANFVELRTEPRADAPLLADPFLHPEGGSGTTRADDWGAKARSGQRFVEAGRDGPWRAIWFAGRRAWLHDPPERRVTVEGGGPMVTPRAGAAAIPVYGRAYPEASAYPPGIPVQPVVPLGYEIPAGQRYVALGFVDRPDYYYAKSYDDSLPQDHTVVAGSDPYYLIQYHHRLAFVRAADVVRVGVLGGGTLPPG